MVSVLLAPDMAQRAILMVLPMIEKLVTDGVVKRGDLAIVILDPLEGNILGQKSLGDEGKWEHDYHRLALHKACLAGRSGLSSRHVAQLEPHRLMVGDTKHAGGVNFNGIPVGVSGVQSYFDEMIANCVAAAYQALCIEAMVKIHADPSRDYVE